MENIAAIVIAFAAMGGLILVGIRLSGKPRPPTWMALGHGVVAVTGFGMLVYVAATTGLPTLSLVAIGFLAAAAVGGAILFFGFHLAEKALPIPLVIGHGLIAVTGFVILLLSVFRVVVL